MSQKKKTDETQALLEDAKKKLSLTREDCELEKRAEMDSLKNVNRDLESQLRSQISEYKKHREDHSAIAGRLASALQTAQIAMAECEAAKAQANGALSEGQTSHSALIQATHRIQQLDQENSSLKSELYLIKAENETQGGEIRKLTNVTNINNNQLAETQNELKRLKAAAQVIYPVLLYICTVSYSARLCTLRFALLERTTLH